MGRGGDGLEASNGGGGKKKRGWVLMEAELVEIAASRYHGGDYTPIDKLFSPFWNWVASLMPSWLAPNLITFSGLMAVSLGSATILFHSSDLASPAPQWCYFVNAGTLFFYQTMDAIDGKQARRTNSANAVGQLMDHGCDSLVTLMCLICASASLRQGATWRPWLVFFNGELAFFAAQWEEYHLGVLNWSTNGWYGVTESQLLQMLLFLLTGIFGSGSWLLPISEVLSTHLGLAGTWYKNIDVTCGDVVLACYTVITTWMVLTSASHVLLARPGALSSEQVGKKSLGILAAFLQVVPIGAVMVLAFTVSLGLGEATYVRHPVLQLLGVGLVVSELICRMIVSHMSRSQLTLHHLASPGVLVLAAAAFNIYCPVLGLGATSPVTHETMLIVCAIASLSSFLYFTAGTVNDLCSHLGIRCFSLKSPRPLKKAS